MCTCHWHHHSPHFSWNGHFQFFRGLAPWGPRSRAEHVWRRGMPALSSTLSSILLASQGAERWPPKNHHFSPLTAPSAAPTDPTSEFSAPKDAAWGGDMIWPIVWPNRPRGSLSTKNTKWILRGLIKWNFRIKNLFCTKLFKTFVRL